MVSLMNKTPRDTTSRRVTRSGTVPRQNGPAIRALREKDGWTQKALAEAAGLRQASLSDIEREASSATAITLNKLARNLGVPVAAILRDKDDEPGVGPFQVPAGAAA
jgi:transcriptional regulator with XRE-family HTH domain